MKKLIIALSLTLFLFSCSSTPESVWIDVRTIEEHAENGINEDYNIPLAQIQADGTLAMFDKDDEINLYCRSGARAGQAKEVLEAAGYTNVINHGGVDDVRALRSSIE